MLHEIQHQSQLSLNDSFNPNWKERALAAEKRLESLDLVLICAQDLVKMWPTVTIRTLGTVTKAIDTLRQALEASK